MKNLLFSRLRRGAFAIAPLSVLIALLFAVGIAAIAQSGPASSYSEVIERGKFILHKFQQRVGEENYEIARDGGSLAVTSSLSISYLGGSASLSATLRAKPDLTPERYEVKGDTSTQSKIDTTVAIAGREASVKERTRSGQVRVPSRFFTIASYAPMTVQMLMFRYWADHGRPSKLPTLPAGEAIIEHRGRDVFTIEGKRVELDRYSIGGVIWGRETLWFDSSKQLIAAIMVDAEWDHFEAVREGYESALQSFVIKAAEDSLITLSRLSAPIAPIHKDKFALVGGTLIDGTGKAPVADSIVVIEGDRITAVGPRSEVKIPKGAKIFDARGKTILPGLWDMHGHYAQVEWGPAYLAAGVTMVRDAGNDFDFIVPVRDAVHSGRGLGPRMLLAGYIDGEGPTGLGKIRASTPEQARAIVNQYKEARFEQIKIYGTGAITPEVVSAITAEAHRLGMTVTGHVPRGMNAFQAVEAGYDQINHLGFVMAVMRDLESDEAKQAIQFFKERGTVVEPTLARGEFSSHPINVPFIEFEPSMAKAPREMVEIFNNTGADPERAARRNVLRSNATLLALYRAGIPIVAGIDLVVPGHSLNRELELYVKAGLTPMEAIQTATIIPARAMKLDKELGTIEAGKLADLMVIEGNPLESISNTRNVKFVVTRGKMYESAPLWKSVGFKP